MDMQTFIMEIGKMNFGVVSFNTYRQSGVPMCYIMIAERGDSGKFIKRECPDFKLDDTLMGLFLELKRQQPQK